MNYYSQFGEDRALVELGILPEKGVYVDVGCNDPFVGNNTAMLRHMGWNGLSIDAIDYSKDYAAIGERFVQAVISDKRSVKFFSACNPALARISNEGDGVLAWRLDDLISERGVQQVDLLSMDLEGGEFDCLMSAAWLVPPRIIISEYLTAALDGGPDVRDDRVEEYLLAHGYDKVWHSCSNNIFLRK